MSSQYDKLGEMLKIALEAGGIPRGQTERHSTEYAASTPAEEVPPVFYMQNEENTSGVKSADTEQQFISSNADVIRAYAVLQLENGAPPAQSKDAYRRLLKKYHPDNTAKFENMQKTAAKKTDEIIQAYKTLEEWFERKEVAGS